MLEVYFEKSFGNFTLQSSFKVEKGVLGILGSSGCGKSMTLKCIAGLYSPDNGSIKLNEKVLFSSDSKINVPTRSRNIGYVFQNYALFPHLTISKNIAYGIKYLEKELRNKKVSQMIQRMQLAGLENHYPSQLSGGQQQRTALARTLITEPDLLLLDEPFSALDSHIKYLLEKELINIIKDNFDGIVLLVTHNIEEAYRISDNIMIIDRGKNIQMGTKKDVIQAPVNLTAARITGCKNFLDVEVLEQKDDCYILRSKELIFKAIKTNAQLSKDMIAGIRANYIKLSPSNYNVENIFECDVIEKIEGVFSNTIIVNCRGCILRIETAKSLSPHITECECEKMKIHIPREKVFLMGKN